MILRSDLPTPDTLAGEMARQFDETPLHNTVADAVADDQILADLCSVAENATLVRDGWDTVGSCTDDALDDVDHAAETVARRAPDRALEVTAAACARLIRERDEWVIEGLAEPYEMDAAVEEARRWLQDNSDVAERVGATVGGNPIGWGASA